MSTSLRMLNIIYTNDMATSVAFYERLGLFRKVDGEINEWWNEFPIGDATLALHWNQDKPLPTGNQPELHLQANAAEFAAIHTAIADLSPSEVQTLASLGHFFTVTDPNGVRVQFNEES